MKNNLVLLVCFTAAIASAQRFDILSGKLENIKGIAQYNVTFDYTGIEVNGFESEAAFLAEKMKKREDHGHPEKAQRFREDWFANRENLYEPAFINYFNNMFKAAEIKVGRNPSAQYTMAIKTTWVYDGYNAGTDVQPAKISAVITISETQKPSKELLVIAFDKVIGIKRSIMTNTLGDRVSCAYEKLAKNLALQMKRFL
jgi:hypothetical protein